MEIKKIFKYDAKTIVDGVEVAGHTAEINSSDVTNVRLNHYQINKESYKANRTQCIKDYSDFADFVYAEQEKLIAES